MKDQSEEFFEYLPSYDLRSLQALSCEAKNQGLNLFLAGGVVRDFLLGLRTKDLDLIVDSDAVVFANNLEKQGIASVVETKECFKTAKIELNSKTFDIASTRTESYPAKGHLPHVERIGVSIFEDAKRRDFSINALYIGLTSEKFEISDFFNGISDIHQKKMKVLHNQSFIDDPSRILRGVKFMARFGFEFEEKTLILLKDYVKNPNFDICFSRLKSELVEIFASCSKEAIEFFFKQKLHKIFSKKEFENAVSIEKTLELLGKFGKRPELFFLIWLFDFFECENYFSFSKIEQKVVKDALFLLENVCLNVSDFDLWKFFKNKQIESVLIYYLKTGNTKVLEYLEKFQHISIKISGKDLINIGFKPGKNFKKIFDQIAKAKIEGKTLSFEDEIEIAKKSIN